MKILYNSNVKERLVVEMTKQQFYTALVTLAFPYFNNFRFPSLTACQRACGPPCPIKGQVFQACRPCPTTCNNPSVICPAVCIPGCGCPSGKVRELSVLRHEHDLYYSFFRYWMQKTNAVLNQGPALMSVLSPKTQDPVKPSYHRTSSIQPPKGRLHMYDLIS